jgi:bleomycin hydrolase
MHKKSILLALALPLLTISMAIYAQERRDKAKFVPKRERPVIVEMQERNRLAKEERDAETSRIRAEQREEKTAEEEEAKELRCDFSSVVKPASPDVFASTFHFEPVRQYLTGTCWCFSTTSYFESEVFRLTGKKIKLSEMFTVYYEFLEEARRYVAERGDSFFDEGSEGNAVMLVWRKHGIVPIDAYKGELDPDGLYDHSEMVAEMKNYLKYANGSDYWDEDTIISSLRIIMDRYMGTPPERITYDSAEMTPVEFLKNVLRLNLDDYIPVMSTSAQPFHQYGEYKVAANWWRSRDYYNVPLDEFYAVIKHAITNGYSVRLNGDVSEPGYYGPEDAAIIPTFDIPGEYIDQDARELRFSNKTTADDHDIHLVGHTVAGDHDWFLIKDSAGSAQLGRFKGYYFYREDYVKLKMLTYIVHRDAIEAVIKEFE